MRNILLLLSVILLSSKGFAQQESEPINFDPAFVHSVYFWLHNPDSAEDRNSFETALKELLMSSKYTKTNYIGTPPKSSRDVVDGSFTYNLLVTFESAEAQEAYQVEDVHLKFIENAKHLWNKVVVYDATGLAE
ncbi:MAG: Dabb family protein [Flavobacteriaceae bacterium]